VSGYLERAAPAALWWLRLSWDGVYWWTGMGATRHAQADVHPVRANASTTTSPTSARRIWFSLAGMSGVLQANLTPPIIQRRSSLPSQMRPWSC
jgi:hypothetical protein